MVRSSRHRDAGLRKRGQLRTAERTNELECMLEGAVMRTPDDAGGQVSAPLEEVEQPNLHQEAYGA
jgi:hypothetical protein